MVLHIILLILFVLSKIFFSKKIINSTKIGNINVETKNSKFNLGGASRFISVEGSKVISKKDIVINWIIDILLVSGICFF